MKKCMLLKSIGFVLIYAFYFSSAVFANPLSIVTPESVGMSSPSLQNIDNISEKAVREKFLRGGVVLVARHGKVCYLKGFGEAEEGKPMRTDAVFRLASMSKTPSIVALLQQWDKGMFQLNDPVSIYIPELKDIKVAELDENGKIRLVPAKRQITIHDVLSFTAGFSTTLFAEIGPIQKLVAEKYAEEGVQDLMNENYSKNLEENVKSIAKCPLIFQPGEGWFYNQTGMDIAARLVELFSGESFNQYLKNNVFTPITANEIWFYPPQEVFSRIPAAYDKPYSLVEITGSFPVGGGTGFVDPKYSFGKNKVYFAAGAGLHGTAIDYFKFAQMLLNKGEFNGVRILSEQAIELMTSIEVKDGIEYRNFISNHRWGYGVDIQESANMKDLNDCWYGGAGSYGWRGFWSTAYFVDPKDDIIVIAMTQMPILATPWICKVNTVAGSSIID